jgi:hypothetical protein
MAYTLQVSPRVDKKFRVITPSGKSVDFGASGYSDYPTHKDYNRMQNYLTRHAAREDWTSTGLNTAGFWSRWILWNLPDLDESIRDTERRFNIRINYTPQDIARPSPSTFPAAPTAPLTHLPQIITMTPSAPPPVLTQLPQIITAPRIPIPTPATSPSRYPALPLPMSPSRYPALPLPMSPPRYPVVPPTRTPVTGPIPGMARMPGPTQIPTRIPGPSSIPTPFY